MSQTVTLRHEVQTPLDLGDYTIEVEQTVGAGGTRTFSARRDFIVAGPRFVVPPADVTSIFPPASTNGDYNSFLPYLTLRRATLPWERQPVEGDDRPWLALLILTEDDRRGGIEVGQRTVKPLCTERGLPLSRADDRDAGIVVVSGAAPTLGRLLPSLDEAQLLAHVRQPDGEPAEAVVIGNRRPLPNTEYQVHLVSLEGIDPTKLADGTVTGTISLPSLYRWQFTCGADKIGLVERLNDLHCDGLRLPVPEAAASDDFAGLRRDGYAAMPHRLAWGDRSHGLYRGPWLPVTIDEAVADSRQRATGLDGSQGLVDYYTDLGLPDLSLAAAWELGRMTLLRSRDAATAYYRFRRRQAGLAYRAETADEDQHLVLDDVPPTTGAALPAAVRALCAELVDLEAIPYAYLVPDPRMLPEISLRIFRVDWRWVSCLLGGLLSLGRTRSFDRAQEAGYMRQVLPDGIGPRTGILMRSPVVAERPRQAYVFTDAAGVTLPIIRRARLADDVLLIVVDGIMHRMEAQEEPQSAHFGFKEDSEDGVEFFQKDLRDPETFEELTDDDGAGLTLTLSDHHARSDAPAGVLDIGRLAGDLAAMSGKVGAHSHHFALQLVESGARGITITLGDPTLPDDKTNQGAQS